jgi:hypothetical protein
VKGDNMKGQIGWSQWKILLAFPHVIRKEKQKGHYDEEALIG